MIPDLRRLWTRHPLGLNMGMFIWSLSAVTAIIGVAMLLVAFVGLLRDGTGWPVFVATGLAAAVPASALVYLVRPPGASTIVRARDVFLTVTGAWLVAAALGAVPLLFAGEARSYVAAVFEAMSGYTTTGATIFERIEPLPDSVLLWRSVTQWLGGIGIVVLLVGIAPALGAGSTRALFAEVTGPTKERYTPRIADTARALVRIYLVLSVACAVSYMITGMAPFDAVNHAMTTVSTGGFSTHTQSMGYYPQASTRLVSMLFMFLGGVNFGLFILLSMRRRPTIGMRYEFWWYCVTLAAFIAAISATLVGIDEQSAGDAIMDASFSVMSILTTTGYATADFDLWNDTARTIVLGLMFVGGSAGSTVGGIKIYRWMMLGVSIRAELRRLMHPAAVISVRLGDRRLTDRDLLTLMSFIVTYALVFGITAIAVSVASSLDVVSAISAAASSLTLVGPGLGEVGASESYATVSDSGLAILAGAMLLGRLEVFTVLALLTPAFWRRR